MKQIKLFKVPEEVSLANDFLAKNVPESVATVSKGETCFIVVNYDDFTYPNEYKAGEIRELMLSNEKESMTASISKDVMTLDLTNYKKVLANKLDELIEVEAMKMEVVLKDKEKYDWNNHKTVKVAEIKQDITALETSVKNIQNGINKLTESNDRFENKNKCLQSHLDKLA